MKKDGGFGKTAFIILILAAAVLSFFIIKPFLAAIIGGSLLAFIFYPVYTRVKKVIKNENLAAFLIAIAIVVLITIPSVFLLTNLTKETHDLYIETKDKIAAGSVMAGKCQEEEGFICSSINRVNSMMENEAIRKYAIAMVTDFLSYVTDKFGTLVFSVPGIILHIFITLFITFYMLKDGPKFFKRLTTVVPMKVHHQDQIHKQFSDVIYAVIYGSLIVALLQGTLAAFGYWVFGLKGFLFWGIVTAFFAFVPFIGTAAIWFPASIYLAILGYIHGETGMILRAIGLFLYGLIIVGTVDNVIKPILVAERARIHPILILVGVLGGLALFGLIGLIIGPLALALLQTLLLIYERERKHHKKELQTDILGKRNHGARR